MVDKIATHDLGTGKTIIRDLTLAEQAKVDAERAARPPPVPAPLTAEELFDMLEAKGLIVAADRPRP